MTTFPKIPSVLTKRNLNFNGHMLSVFHSNLNFEVWSLNECLWILLQEKSVKIWDFNEYAHSNSAWTSMSNVHWFMKAVWNINPFDSCWRSLQDFHQNLCEIRNKFQLNYWRTYLQLKSMINIWMRVTNEETQSSKGRTRLEFTNDSSQ